MTIDFWSDNHMAEFWSYVKMLLETAAPGVLIWVAIIAVGLLIGIVIKAFKKSSNDDNDDDYEVRHY